MRTEVRRRLDEDATTPNFWTAADINTALDEALDEISDASEWYERQVSVPLLSGRTYYDMRRICSPHTFLSPRRCYNTTTSSWLEPIGERDLDERTFRQWGRNNGEPERMWTRGLWWLGTYPRKGSDSGYLKLYFTSTPPSFSSDTDTPGFPQEFHLGLVHYALFDLYAQDLETKKAAEHLAAYTGIQNALKAWVDKRIRTDRINALRG